MGKTEFKNFLKQLSSDREKQLEMNESMTDVMKSLIPDIALLQKQVNSKVSEGIISFAKQNNYDISNEDIKELFVIMDESLHKDMDEMFKEEYTQAIKKYIDK